MKRSGRIMTETSGKLEDLVFNLKQVPFPKGSNNEIVFEITDELREEILMYYSDLKSKNGPQEWREIDLKVLYEEFYNKKLAELESQKNDETAICKLKQESISHVKNQVLLEYQFRTNLIRNALDYTIGTLNMLFFCTLQTINEFSSIIENMNIDTIFKNIEDTEYVYKRIGYDLLEDVNWQIIKSRYYDESKIENDLFMGFKWLEKQREQFIYPKKLAQRTIKGKEIPLYNLNAITLNSFPLKTNTMSFEDLLGVFSDFWKNMPSKFYLEKGQPHFATIVFNEMSKYSKDKFVSRISSICRYYNQGNDSIFKNRYDWDNLSKQLEEETSEEYSYLKYVPESDGAEFFDKVLENTESYLLNHYTHHMNTLALLYQVFEQRLRRFIFEEINHHLNEFEISSPFSSFGGTFDEICNTYKLIGIDLMKIGMAHSNKKKTWENIMILKDVVNVYKHGEGSSSKRLRKRT